MAANNQSKNTFLFKYDMSENAMNKLFEKKEMSSLLEPGDEHDPGRQLYTCLRLQEQKLLRQHTLPDQYISDRIL